MEKIKSWFFKGKDVKEFDSNENEPKVDTMAQTEIISTQVEEVDPKVAEFFKNFPEPYKSKAINRFSSRDGLYQWDLIRDLAMRREYDAGKRGAFLEDKRDFSRRLQEDEDKYVQRAKEEKSLALKNRIIPEWEETIRKKIPVHEEETLGLKLFQTANLSVLGGVLLWAGITLKKRRPTVPSWQYYMTVTGTTYLFCYCQVAAAYRLMDWGPFDRSIDNRHVLTKAAEEIKQFFTSVKDTMLQEEKKNES